MKPFTPDLSLCYHPTAHRGVSCMQVGAAPFCSSWIIFSPLLFLAGPIRRALNSTTACCISLLTHQLSPHHCCLSIPNHHGVSICLCYESVGRFLFNFSFQMLILPGKAEVSSRNSWQQQSTISHLTCQSLHV